MSFAWLRQQPSWFWPISLGWLAISWAGMGLLHALCDAVGFYGSYFTRVPCSRLLLTLMLAAGVLLMARSLRRPLLVISVIVVAAAIARPWIGTFEMYSEMKRSFNGFGDYIMSGFSWRDIIDLTLRPLVQVLPALALGMLLAIAPVRAAVSDCCAERTTRTRPVALSWPVAIGASFLCCGYAQASNIFLTLGSFAADGDWPSRNVDDLLELIAFLSAAFGYASICAGGFALLVRRSCRVFWWSIGISIAVLLLATGLWAFHVSSSVTPSDDLRKLLVSINVTAGAAVLFGLLFLGGKPAHQLREWARPTPAAPESESVEVRS